jgi:Tfp pilus assembly protein PilE
MGRIIGIVLVVALLGFGAYKIFSSSVDRTNRDEVGAAFLKALKKEEVGKAKKYYIPAEADAWETATKATIGQMRSNATAAFKGAIPDEPTFGPAPTPKGSTDQWIKAGDTTLGMRQIDGEWYVSKSSQP